MSKKRYKEHAAKREAGGYAPLPYAVIRSAEFGAIPPFGVKLMVDLLAQYRGDNNGDLCAAWTLMTERGWKSRDSLGKALADLQVRNFLQVTRQGGRHKATLYAVTFFEIDYCGGKLDITAPNRSFMGTWRRPDMAIPLTRPPVQLNNDCPAERVNSLPASANCPAERVSQGGFPETIDPPAVHLFRSTNSPRTAMEESC